MDCIERAHSHRSSSSGGGGEFFVCFTARLSSTRPHSSKSHMSPGRSAPSLSASLSRRLRSGSVKGAQSPMFGARRKGCAFEAAEPSSPKVTCIGQVRVKSKKKKKATVAMSGPLTRARSQREASFRRAAPEVEVKRECNQSWVYQLPLSICEALRNIGSEVNCFVPCRGGRSPCSSSPSKVKRRTKSTSSCGAVFARWLMAIDEEGEEVVEEREREREKREVGFFVREMDAKEVEVIGLDGLRSDLKEEVLLVEEEGRVSVCIPPPNALLLMRCRSDPARVAALADRFWGSPAAAKAPVTDFREEDGNAAEEHTEEEVADEEQQEQVVGQDLNVQSELAVSLETEDAARAEEDETVEPAVELEDRKLDQEEEAEARITQDALVGTVQSSADNVAGLVEPDQEELKIDNNVEIEKGRRCISLSQSCKSKEAGRRRSVSSRDKERRRHSISSEQEARRKSFESEKDARRASFSECRRRQSFYLEKEELAPKQNPSISATTDVVTCIAAADVEIVVQDFIEPSNPVEGIEVISTAQFEKADDKPRDQLPACLLQMMYEPKLSMEVSRETWVCSDDFLRWRPHHHQRASVKQIAVDVNAARGNEECNGIDEGPTLAQQAELPDQPPTPPPPPVKQPSPPPPPPRPLPPVVMAVVEKKMVAPSTAGYGTPLVLTRCNSEPGRSSAKLAPDACFWKSRHQPIGAAGVGF